METLRVVLITIPRDEVKPFAKLLVDKRLAACVNIIPKTESYYWSDGKVNYDEESLVLAKTTPNKVEELIEYVKDNHPYEVPEVLTFKIAEGLPLYVDWVMYECGKEPLET